MSCSSPASRTRVRRGVRTAEARAARRPLAFDAAGPSALELDEPSELHELGEALFVAQRGDHAGEVADRGDRGPDSPAERLAVGGAAQVVVAAGAGRLAVVFLPGYSRPLIRVEEFLELVERCTFRDDRVRPVAGAS